MKAGPREIRITFPIERRRLLETLVGRSCALSRGWGRAYTTAQGRVPVEREISGPFDATGAGDTPSRRRIFVCRPATAAAEAVCAKTILSTLARRAYRRPVTDADVQLLLDVLQRGPAPGRIRGGHRTGAPACW